MAARTIQSKAWLFTVNNPKDYDDPKLWESKFLTYQLEKGVEGTPHFQGYVLFEKNLRLSAVKLINPRAHWEVRKGTHEEAVKYCNKEETRVEGPWTIGTSPITLGQGHRTDIDICMAEIKNGCTELELAEKYATTWCRNYKSFNRYKMLAKKDRRFKSQVSVTYGKTGSGKSSLLAEKFPDAYWKPKGNWWDGYEGQEHVIIDEFYGWLPYDFLLRLCDRYPLIVEFKGGFAQFTSKYIHFTSNKAPEFWYSAEHSFAPLLRRIEMIQKLDEFGTEPIIQKNGKDDIYDQGSTSSNFDPIAHIEAAVTLQRLNPEPLALQYSLTPILLDCDEEISEKENIPVTN